MNSSKSHHLMSCYWKRGLDRVKVENIYAPASDQTLNQQKFCEIGTRIAQTQHKIGTRMTPFRRRNSVSKQWRWRYDQRHIWRVSVQLVLKIGTRSPALDYHLFRLIQNISGRGYIIQLDFSWTPPNTPCANDVFIFFRQRMSKEGSFGFCILQIYDNMSVIISS